MFVLSYSVDYILGEDDRGFLILFKFRFSCKIYWRFAGLKNDSDTEKHDLAEVIVNSEKNDKEEWE